MTPLLSALGLAAAWALAGVFAWAAAAKLIRPAATASGFARLGLPAPRALALAVPLVEGALAVLLLARPALGGMAALLLLTVFSVLLTVRLRAGQRTGCGCFGTSARAELSSVELFRNAGLGTGALLALGASAPGLPTLPALIAVSSASVSGLVLLTLLQVRSESGRLLDNTVGRGPAGLAAGPGATSEDWSR